MNGTTPLLKTTKHIMRKENSIKPTKNNMLDKNKDKVIYSDHKKKGKKKTSTKKK